MGRTTAETEEPNGDAGAHPNELGLDGGSTATAKPGPDAGTSPEEGLSCTGTAMRSYQPLGKATAKSVVTSIVAAGDGAVVAWEERADTDATGRVYFASVDSEGRTVKPRQIATGDSPVLLVARDEVVLFWKKDSAITMRRMTLAGDPTADDVRVYGPVADSFQVEYADHGYLFATNGSGTDAYQVYMFTADAAGIVDEPPVKVAQAGNNSVQPALAWNGSYATLAWTDMREGTPAVYAATFDAKGKRRTDDLRISAKDVRGSFPSTAMQTLGGSIVCYQQRLSAKNQEIYCSRLDDDGKVTGTSRVTNNAFDSLNPIVKAHGKYTWVAWDDRTQDAPSIQWQFLDESGATILREPKDSGIFGWRPSAAVGKDALYFTSYNASDDEVTWRADVSTVNCF
ncbi:MAG: hypothetical protein U0169_21860 [Polyangiaceae bacterium]